MRLRALIVLLFFLSTASWTVALLYMPREANAGLLITQLNSSPITGARVDRVIVDESSRTVTVTVRNMSDNPITAFDLVIHTFSADKQSDMSDISFRLEDLLLGISAGKSAGIRPGETFDEVIHGVAANMAIDLDLVVFSDASAEFTNREMLMRVMAARKAIADANNRTKEIIRTASTKEEAIDQLTRLWEESKETAPLMTPVLQTHLYNLKNQHGQSVDDEKQLMLNYADKNEKDARFISFHASLHGRAQ